MIQNVNQTRLTAGEWAWTDCGEDGEPALSLRGQEIRAGDSVDATCLRQLSLDLMKLANAVANRP